MDQDHGRPWALPLRRPAHVGEDPRRLAFPRLALVVDLLDQAFAIAPSGRRGFLQFCHVPGARVGLVADPTQAFQEPIDLADDGGVEGLLLAVEAMVLAVIAEKLAGVAGLLHFGGKPLHVLVTHGLVGLAVKDHRRRQSGAYVVHGRSLACARPQLLRAVAGLGRVDHRVEQDQGVGLARGARVLARLIQPGDQCGGCGHVSARRTAAGGDPIRIDAQLGRMRADPAQGRLAVGHAGQGIGAVPRLGAVLGQHGHHAPRREMGRMPGELCRLAAHPAAAKEDHDRRPAVRRLVVGRSVDKQAQAHIADRLVDVRRSARQLGRDLRRPAFGRHKAQDHAQDRLRSSATDRAWPMRPGREATVHGDLCGGS